MTDYKELIRSLRNCSNNRCAPCDCEWFNKYQVDESCKEIIMWKAADAIEALQAEQKKTVTQIFGEEQQKWTEYCTALGNRIKELEQQMPKRGKWVLSYWANAHILYRCSVCGNEMLTNPDYVKKHKYCFSCGAKMMEVQDGQK